MALTNSNKKIIITSALLGVVILTLIWLAFFWEAKRVKDVSENYQKEKLNSFVIQEKKNKFAKLNKEIANLKENTDELSAMFLRKDQALPVLKGLEDVASRSSCKIVITPADISKIKFASSTNQQKNTSSDENDTTVQKDQPASSDTGQKKIDELAPLKNYPAFSVQITGTYPNAVNFVSKMENLPYFVRPLIVDIVPAGKSKQVNTGSSGTLSIGTSSTQNQQADQSEENKNVMMTLIIVIYGNQ